MSSPLLVSLLLVSAGVSCRSVDKPSAPQIDAATSSEHWVDGGCQGDPPCSGVAGASCDDYDTQRRSISESMTAQCLGHSRCGTTAEAGRCGAARYVHYRDPYGADTSYFGADGKPFARRRESAFSVFCGMTVKSATFGNLPSCTHVLVEDFIPGSPTPRLGTRASGAHDGG